MATISMSSSIDGSLRWLIVATMLVPAAATRAAELSLAQKVEILITAYPETLLKAEDGHAHFRSGGTLPVDDGKAKDHAGKLATGDIEDSLSQIYPAGACETKPDVNFDPGRIRSDALMMRLYGASAEQVEASLVSVDWFGKKLRVTKRQGAAAALEKVRDELKAIPEIAAFLSPSAGTFNWRKVAGASNMSVHSFGAAIDINTKYADYWLWAGGKPGRVPHHKNRYPMKIVDAFERHGFIWGGRWYHYDTMHFEYRPELIAIGKAAGVSACR
ncbi:M15 family metallopeptidase [Pararhizobium sp. BT-229]|uniref:M15 family metallopeptidase n=1 Tax=Pararhizobium sp. BT-229 TaxID=2986923 RepID=UPI0021F7F857|nr:M15 family metallopeptidase [Pararhizobium sp. BT-229]MCV9960633.1 M15 family metallopeptidase [Pararhizobium sp. BT-229]